MCTSISYKANDHYFGRNLDWECSFGEQVVITPRNYPFQFSAGTIEHHYAMIGMALIENQYPLYFDATNELGLSMAGLNFPGNAYYHHPNNSKTNVASYELIPWILSQCKNVTEVTEKLKDTTITNQAFNDNFPPSPLHWIIADRNKCVTLESTVDGIHIHKNPWGVLTNNPPFEYHAHNICNYLNLSSTDPHNNIAPKTQMRPYSRGMGAIGLPGDFSSASRFVRSVFIKSNITHGITNEENITQFFHMLNLVEQPCGCIQTENGPEKTIYSSCCNTDHGIYYYTTYENRQITAISMYDANLESNVLTNYPLIRSQNILNAK